MGIHGFAAAKEFAIAQQSEDSLTLELHSNEKTRKSYPFDFALCITYALRANAVEITYSVKNLGQNIMPFGIGGHPGFNAPLIDGEKFEDYELEFSYPCQPDRVGFSPAVYLNGQDELYPLREDKYIDLRHDLFDEDAVILKNMAREVILRSRISGRGVRVGFPEKRFVKVFFAKVHKKVAMRESYAPAFCN